MTRNEAGDGGSGVWLGTHLGVRTTGLEGEALLHQVSGVRACGRKFRVGAYPVHEFDEGQCVRVTVASDAAKYERRQCRDYRRFDFDA